MKRRKWRDGNIGYGDTNSLINEINISLLFILLSENLLSKEDKTLIFMYKK